MDFTFYIRVQPGASRNELVPEEREPKLRIQAPAVEGKANKACIQFLSKFFKIPKRRMEITRGERARKKEITIFDVNEAELRRIKGVIKYR